MAVGMTMDELAALLPLEQSIPITDAAKMLGGGATRIKALMDSVVTRGLFSWTHSSPHMSPAVITYNKTGVTKELPYLTPDTDPSTVLVESKEILWRWSLEVEELRLAVDGDGRAPRDRVTARLQALQSRAYELKTGSKPAPLGGAGIAATAPATRWPWGDHHTEALGHMEAAAQRFWVNYDPADASTAPTNQRVVDWLRQERTVSPNLAKSIASILRQDGLPSGPR